MKTGHWIGLAAVLIALVLGYAWLRSPPSGDGDYAAPPMTEAPLADTGETDGLPEQSLPAVEHPLGDESSAQGAPLPALDDSDAALRAAAVEALGEQPVEAFLIPQQIVRRLVATINSLDAEPVPMRVRSVPPIPEAFAVQRSGKRITLDPANADRYEAFVSAMQAADTATLVAVYRRYYPLFQKAYEQLGFPGLYFNDRVIAIIDHLLSTPQIDGPIELTQPKVMFLYADPTLERRSCGQKLLIRLGADNAAAVKDKLSEIRTLLARARDASAD
ncbi:DUF3014 domain-containing protein [Sinimarinibacterium sp. CAU 1509]|uniref:DUF3014 domain-containing protein n=1 Tax=Sinimarinibacterium sp. CAU 1509 TaxID=2562283 RepID=UPI0010AC7616|nr:DUF3014 domain-containing protein [Sinimarinibacterium sp. CAU 1509]TJY64988.1 DUF3014 domain-containing protein [Sinimarinibacterium sp. CAU 1509]